MFATVDFGIAIPMRVEKKKGKQNVFIIFAFVFASLDKLELSNKILSRSLIVTAILVYNSWSWEGENKTRNWEK